ncbi:hypothetical protein [Streptomyces sp. NPDC007984]|uniref:hypothetical protein n=1 Tax=Streptomyces sp. NPDC007984 TaxID=3364801 RepID=UPI0036E42480
MPIGIVAKLIMDVVQGLGVEAIKQVEKNHNEQKRDAHRDAATSGHSEHTGGQINWWCRKCDESGILQSEHEASHGEKMNRFCERCNPRDFWRL